MERGATRVLLVPGDCPALDPAELDELLEDAEGVATPDVVVVPDRHGDGTNALLLTPPDAIQPAFGPGSRERHERLAQEAGATVHGDRRADARPRRRHRRRPRRAAHGAGGRPRRRVAHARPAGALRPRRRPMITARALPGLPEVRAGDDLAALLATARARARRRPRGFGAGEVLVVAHKVVSKAEGRVVALADVEPSPRAIELTDAPRRRQGPAPRRGRPARERRDRPRRARRPDLPHPPRLRLRQRRRRRLQRRARRRADPAARRPRRLGARAARRAARPSARSSSPTPSAAPGATASATSRSGSPASRRWRTGAGAPTPTAASCTPRGSRPPTRPPRPPTSPAAARTPASPRCSSPGWSAT